MLNHTMNGNVTEYNFVYYDIILLVVMKNIFY